MKGHVRAGSATVLAALVAVFAAMKWVQSGSSIVVFVGGAVVAAMVLDASIARAVVVRARLAASSSSYDAVVGDILTIRVSATGSARPIAVRGAGVDRGLATVRVLPPATAKMPCTVGPRGVFTRLEVEVSSTGLCDLLGWGGDVRVPFSEAIYVGARPVDPGAPLPELAFTAPEGAPRPSVSGDIVRGVRPYVRGDALRRVHWPATARTGDLMVMEVEEPVAPRLLIVLSLGANGYAAEQAAGRAAWYAREALRRDYDVRLATVEAAGPVVGLVASASDVNRRLATAINGPLKVASGPEGITATVQVTEAGDTWGS
ncbi:MAG TPA: DUF58 domain-containing protein [Acidimicrobiales bacterium]|nr:DUF58 domain-containing protein [Acidimicrobiales bacterium]